MCEKVSKYAMQAAPADFDYFIYRERGFLTDPFAAA
jgi:hypothetical protein